MPLGFEAGVLSHPYTYLGIVALALSAGSALLILRRTTGSASRWLAAQFVAGSAWIAFNLVHFGASAESVMLFGQFAKSTAIWVMTLCWVGFAVTYADRADWTTPRRWVLLALPPATFVCLTWADPFVGVLWSGHHPVASGPVTVLQGIETPVRTAEYLLQSGYAALGAAVLYRGVGPRRIHRKQVWTLVLAVVLVVAGAWFTVSDLYPYSAVSIAPFFVGLSTPLLLWAFFGYELLDIAPVARDRVFETLDAPVVVVDADYRVVDFNPAATDVVGLDEDDVGTLVGAAFPAYAEQVGLPDPEDCPPTDGGARSDLVLPVDGEQRTYEVGVTPVFAGGRIGGWTIRCTDVTHRVRRADRLRRQNERLDRFASIVSHDLRNPLAVAEGYAEQLAADAELDGDPRVREVNAALGEMDELIDGVLAMARAGDVEETELVDLGMVVDRAWEPAAELSDGTATLENDLSGYPVQADPDQIQRALENLFRNSVEHGSTSSRDSENPGDIAEETSASSQSPKDSGDSVEHGSTSSRPEAGDSVEHGSADDSGVTVRVFGTDEGFAVADDGQGIPEGEREAVFDYGESSDADSTGIGLAAVRTIVEGHGWSVEAGESEAGGARFDVSIPDRGE